MRYFILALIVLGLFSAALAEEVVLRPGESLEGLAERALGQAGLWRLILSANEELTERDPLPGERLTLPGPEVGWAELVSGNGHVVIGRDHGGFEPLSPDTAVAPGDTARTGELSTAELSVGGARVTLSPNTALRLEGVVRSGEAASTLLELLYGRVRAALEAVLAEGEEFRIGGPTAVAIVRGTDFEVSVPDPGVTQIAVYRGRVQVEPRLRGEAAGESFELGPGEGAVVREHGVIRVRLLGEPRPVGPEDGAVLAFTEDARRSVRLDWEAPVGATLMSVQIAADPDCTRLYEERELAAGDGLNLELAPGEYYWRVAASDDNGLRGPFGPVRRFSVVIDDEPPGLNIQGWKLGGGGRTLTVWGETTDAVNLVVGASPVPLSGDGSFETTLPAGAYDGSLPLIVRDGAGNSAEHRLVFRIPDLPLGLIGPTGGTGLSSLVSARSLEPWGLRVAFGVDYYDWLIGTPAPEYNPLLRAAQPWMAVSLGLGGWGEFALKTPYVNQIFSGGETFGGMGDLMLEGKLSPPQTGDFTYALYSRLALPTGPTYPERDDVANYRPPVDLGLQTPDGRVASVAGLALQYDFLKGGVLGNLGYDFSEGGALEGGLGFIWAATGWLSLSIEGQYAVSPLNDFSLIPGLHFRAADLEFSLYADVPFDRDEVLEVGLALVLFEL